MRVLVATLIFVVGAGPAPAEQYLRCVTPRTTIADGVPHRTWINVYTKPSSGATIMSYTIASPLPLWVVAESGAFSRVTTGNLLSEWPFKALAGLGWVRTSDVQEQAIRNCT